MVCSFNLSAIEYYRLTLEKESPDRKNTTRNNLARLLAENGQLEEAIELYTQTILADADNEYALKNRKLLQRRIQTKG